MNKASKRLVAGFTAAAGMTGLIVFGPTPSSTQADSEFEVTRTVLATVRDFTDTHPDFESFGISTVRSGMLLDELDAEGCPQLDPAHLSSASPTVTSMESFGQWYRDVPGVNIPLTVPIELVYDRVSQVYSFERDLDSGQMYFPIDGQGYDDRVEDSNGELRNFWFTTELDLEFAYTSLESRGGRRAVLEFKGDDDVFVFINGKLALTLGGIHFQQTGVVDVDDLADDLGLVPGRVYPLKVFHAERKRVQSNFNLQTNLNLLLSSDFLAYD